jgi:hypothetical protein
MEKMVREYATALYGTIHDVHMFHPTVPLFISWDLKCEYMLAKFYRLLPSS